MKFVFCVLIFVCLSCIAGAQVITTIAGGATSGLGDGGPATGAVLNNPYGIAIDKEHNIYFADRNNNRICRIDAAGIITTIAGTGRAGYSGDGKAAVKAKVNYPISVALDGNGDLLFSDRQNNCIRKISPATGGIITTIAGTGYAGYSGEGGQATSAEFNGPAGILVDPDGSIYVCDAFNNCIRRINASGIITTVAGNASRGYYGEGRMAMDAELYQPYFMAKDDSGNLFFTEYGNQYVRKISPKGTITTVAGNGVMTYSGDGGPATSASLHHPTGITIDKAGNILVADGDNNQIRCINRLGIISTIAGSSIAGFSGDGGTPTTAMLAGPVGIAIDGDDNLYITDLGNNRIRMISAVAHSATAAAPGPIEVYADPSAMALSFKFKATGEVAIKLMDLDGKLLAQQKINNRPAAVFDVKNFAPGLYQYEVIISGKKQTGTFRLE